MPPLWKLSGLTWKELLKQTWKRFRKDGILDQSAKLSFYFLLSIFPLLLFLIGVLGLFLQSGPVLQETLHTYLTAVIPESASGLIDTTLGEITRASGGGKLSLALVFALWAASRGMMAIMEGLNIAYAVGESRRWWKQNLAALAMTILTAVLISSALLLMIYGSRIGQIIGNHIGLSGLIAGVWQVLQWLILLAFMLMAFNILYVYAPNVKHRRWHWLMPGTVAGVGLWLVVSFGFKIYLSFFNRYTVTYGSIGAVIILLMWFYLSGIAILVGGEVNSEIEKAAELRAHLNKVNSR